MLDEEKTEAQRLFDDIRDINYIRHKLSVERKVNFIVKQPDRQPDSK